MAEEMVFEPASAIKMAGRRTGRTLPTKFLPPDNDRRKDDNSFYIHPTGSPNAPVQLAVKRLFDAVCASLGLLFLAPVFFLIAVFIKLGSKGPALTRQLHTGLNEVPFDVLRFRCEYRRGMPHAPAAPPLTPIGRILQKTHLDGLPQLWNVLAGDMSLVGPSPHVPDMQVGGQRYAELVEGYEYRHLMRPGLTGLTQARHLHGLAGHRWMVIRRIVCDVNYIRNFSLIMDVKIVSRNILNALKSATGL
ncbi:sugar transferase [Pararhizobium sp. PWRC1-1]|uniref:sugar transferase n=1 Tax=Pararhizobium sp. PWRC1-1 TaxID=2804566 RepID=UPI003CF4AE5C